MRILSPETISMALLVVFGICLLTAGCTSTTSNATTQQTTPAATAEATAAPAAGTTASGAAAGSVSAVPFATLISFLPAAPAGWTADEPLGATLTVEDGQWAWASCDYTRDDTTATVLIQDSAYYDVGYWDSWDTLVELETTEGYYRQGQVGGYPSWEVFSKPASYGTWVGVHERFMVYVSVEGGSKQDLDAFVNAIDCAGLANQK